MRLLRIDQAIEVCQAHLEHSGATGTEIEAYVTRYVLVLMCATFEEEIESLVIERAETFFNNIVTNRHDTAHSAGSHVSFAELVRFYLEGHVVLDAVKMALEFER